MKQKKQYTDFSNEELAHAIELLVAPTDLAHREVMVAILKALDFSPEEVAAQLESEEHLNDGPSLLWPINL